MSVTICDLFRWSARSHPGDPCIWYKGRTYTYAQLWNQSVAIAGWLRQQGLRAGDRVLIYGKNSPEYAAAYFGTLLAGGIAVLCGPAFCQRDLREIVRDSHPRAGIGCGSFFQTLQRCGALPAGIPTLSFCEPDGDGTVSSLHAQARGLGDNCPEPEPSDFAHIIYGTDSAGRWRGATFRHCHVTHAVRTLLTTIELDDAVRAAVTLPFHESPGLLGLVLLTAVGAEIVLANSTPLPTHDDVDMLWLRSAAVPEVIDNAGSDLPEQLICWGPSDTDVHGPLRELGVQTAAFHWHHTVAGPILRILSFDGDAVGKPVDGIHAQVQSKCSCGHGDCPGELVVSGDSVMAGYWDRIQAAAVDGEQEPVGTGDLAIRESEDRIRLLGRADRSFYVEGRRVHPAEIERVLVQLTGVRHAVVVPLTSSSGANTAGAVVVLASAAATSKQEILEYCAQQLPEHKRPVRLVVADRIPTNGDGSPDTRAIRALLLNEAASGRSSVSQA